MTEQTKNIFQSKTIWGGILLALVALLNTFGVEVGQDELAMVSEAITTVVGFGLVIWGRFTVKKKVTLGKGSTDEK